MNSPSRLLGYAAAAALAMLLGAWVAWSLRATPGAVQTATVYQTARPFPKLALVDQTGQPFGPAQLRGHWSWLFFGFTHCPDVCPTTLQMLKNARAAVPDDRDAPTVVLMTVDPQRDTPEILARYVAHFDPGFMAATGSPDTIDRLTAELFVSHARVPLENGGYTVDHSASIFFVNPDADIVAVSTPPHAARILAADFLSLRAGGR